MHVLSELKTCAWQCSIELDDEESRKRPREDIICTVRGTFVRGDIVLNRDISPKLLDDIAML